MKEIQELFVPKDLSFGLKENGFNEPCLAFYSANRVYPDQDYNKTDFILLSAKKRGELVGHGTVQNALFKLIANSGWSNGELATLSTACAAPTYDQVFDWLKEKYGIQLFPDYTFHDGFYYGYKFCKADGSYGFYWKPGNNEEPDGCHTLKEARIFAIEQALKQI